MRIVLDRFEVPNGPLGRDIPLKLYHQEPKPEKPQPLIIWSHGLGGGREGAGFISRHLAENGYYILHIQHPGTDTSLWEGKPGHPWDNIRAAKISRDITLARFQDISFVLDQLQDLEKQFGLSIDHEKLGMSGHSFGALTTQVVLGQLFPDEDGKLISLKDDRFAAGLAYSPNPITHLVDASAEALYTPIDIPILYMTGTLDSSPISEKDYTHRLPVFEHTGAEEKYLYVLEGGDHMIFSGSRGQLSKADNRAAQEQLIKDISLKFWNSRFKGDINALNDINTLTQTSQ